MANPSKDKGTRFETACVRYLRDALDDERIERRALAGAHDKGDIFGIRAHGSAVIAECKSHATVTAGLIERWRDETLCERGNADADAAILIVKVPGKADAKADVHVTLGDLLKLIGPFSGAWADDVWVRVDLETACDLMKGAIE